jgi:hypothetical protein
VELTGLPQEALVLLTIPVRPPDAEVLVAQPRRGALASARVLAMIAGCGALFRRRPWRRGRRHR